MTIEAGVVGSPARHSLSPVIHGAWIEAAGLDAHYAIFDLAPDGFGAFLREARARGLAGVNVTLPFKEEALVAAGRASEAARSAGAANLLLFSRAMVSADNTDGLGLLQALKSQAGFAPAGRVVTLLGAGGAARGAAAALVAAGAREVRVVNRTRLRADDLARAIGERVEVFEWSEMRAALTGAELLINATSRGLNGLDDLDIPIADLPAGAPVMDMVYRPLETGLLARARARGHPVVDGLEMLIGQAAPSFEALFGQPPPKVDVRALALKALGR
jgi:shikimate dehydrogenase